MNSLSRTLNAYFKPEAPRRQKDPHYAAFRAYCKTKGITYKVARDGFIEFSDGVVFAHYGDWAETLSGHKETNGIQ
jgi:hypothetical protein